MDRETFERITGGTATLDWVPRCTGCMPEDVRPHRCTGWWNWRPCHCQECRRDS